MRKTTSRALAYLLAHTVVLGSSVGWSRNGDPVEQQDPATIERLLNCDRQAEREAAQASMLTPVAPTSVLNPILLLNDLNRRKQEEANQPQLLNQIELRRQQCRANVVAAAARKSQEVLGQRADVARGYKLISFETFALDGKSMAAAQTRISMKGAYVPDGNMEWLFPGQVEAMQARNSPVGGSSIARIPLLTEDASRDFRKALLRCKSTPGADQMGCLTTITGHVSVCSITSGLGVRRDIPCIVVENGR
jgi:hypothetical protein